MKVASATQIGAHRARHMIKVRALVLVGRQDSGQQQ
jgi:hypothetical protein